MKYVIISSLIGWIFPTKDDRRNFKNFCQKIDERKNSIKIRNQQREVLKRLRKEFPLRKIKVVFLNSENAKWGYQNLYDELSSNPKFEVQILLTVRLDVLKNKYKKLDYVKEIQDSYKFFKELGMNVDYAFDVKSKKFINLNKFKPDIIFYEQPWQIAKIHQLPETSKFSLAFCNSYGSNITAGSNEYSGLLYKDVCTYFLDNNFAKEFLIEKGLDENRLTVAGQLKLDTYQKPIDQSNIIWKTNGKKRIIWAPHHSFYDKSVLRYGTFDWNFKFLYEYAKEHQEFEFILKPHPLLKKQIINQNIMTVEEMNKYFEDWAQLPNAQVFEYNGYFDMFRTSDVMITDSSSFLYEYLPTGKPIIHLINKKSVGYNIFGQKIIKGYYKAFNTEDISLLINKLLVDCDDNLYDLRQDIINNDLCQPKEGTAHFMINHITNIITGKGEI